MNFTYDITMFKETFEAEFTWLNGFMRNVRRFGYKPAVISPAEKKQWTYEELNADANRLANALKACGVQKSDVVMFQNVTVSGPYFSRSSSSLAPISSSA